MTVHRTVFTVENQMRNSDPNARVNIYQDDLTLNGNADPWQEASPSSKRSSRPSASNSTRTSQPSGRTPTDSPTTPTIVERTGMKRADAPIIFHLNSNLDDATNNTATTATLPLDSERPFHNETEKTELNILPRQEDRLHQETRDPH